jgi:hypothetical protein
MIHLDVNKEEVVRLCGAHRVHRLALFGSVLGDRFSPASDVDVLVEFEPGAHVGFLALARLARELSGLFGRRVDVVPAGGLKDRIRQEVLAEAEVIFEA